MLNMILWVCSADSAVPGCSLEGSEAGGLPSLAMQGLKPVSETEFDCRTRGPHCSTVCLPLLLLLGWGFLVTSAIHSYLPGSEMKFDCRTQLAIATEAFIVPHPANSSPAQSKTATRFTS